MGRFSKKHLVDDTMRFLCSDHMDASLSACSDMKTKIRFLDRDEWFVNLLDLCLTYKTARDMVRSRIKHLYKEDSSDRNYNHSYDLQIMTLLYAIIRADGSGMINDPMHWIDWCENVFGGNIGDLFHTHRLISAFCSDEEEEESAGKYTPTPLQEVLLEWSEWKRTNWPVEPRKDEESQHEYVALPVDMWKRFVEVMEKLEDVAEFSPR